MGAVDVNTHYSIQLTTFFSWSWCLKLLKTQEKATVAEIRIDQDGSCMAALCAGIFWNQGTVKMEMKGKMVRKGLRWEV